MEHTFSVPASVDDVWAALLEPELVAPCMPGAMLTAVDGNTFEGKVKVKLGPVSLQYKGTGEYIEMDESTHTVVIKASGKDARGNGTAAATVTLRLTGDGARTEGKATTDLTITGKPAQFGRGMISDVGGKILEQFAGCLSNKLGPAGAPGQAAPPGQESANVAPADTSPTYGAHAKAESAAPIAPDEAAAPAAKPVRVLPAEEAEPLDLTQYASGAVAKRAVPAAAAAALIALVVFLLVRRLRGSDEA